MRKSMDGTGSRKNTRCACKMGAIRGGRLKRQDARVLENRDKKKDGLGKHLLTQLGGTEKRQSTSDIPGTHTISMGKVKGDGNGTANS